MISPQINGVLPCQHIEEMLQKGQVQTDISLKENQIQPASLDVRTGKRAYRLRTSFLPKQGEPIAEALEELSLYDFALTNKGSILEVGCTYLVPVQETLNLPADISGSASPKSTTGRLDIFCRIFTENGTRFDAIPAGYTGTVWLEVTPMSFPILLRNGDTLIQLRFRRGNTKNSTIADIQTWEEGLLFDANHKPLNTTEHGLGLTLGLEPMAGGSPVAYRAKRNTPVVDLRNIAGHDWAQYWEVIEPENGGLILYPNDFYILGSAEKLCVPAHLSAEMVPFDITYGEIRVHYAGFFDPGFGLVEGTPHGTRGVLEVRNHGAPFRVTHGQQIARMEYEHVLETPTRLYGAGEIKSNYAAQEVKLAKQFKMPTQM